MNDSMQERERLIKYNKIYCKTHDGIPPTSLEYYKLIKLIGKGAFGKVSLGLHKLTSKYVAIKSIDKAIMKDEYQKNKVMREVSVMKRMSHNNIVRLLEVFESAHHLLLVIEYSDKGDLLQHVKRKGGLDEQEARKIFKQVVYGVAHIHSTGVLHRDIKLDNILLDSSDVVKICDFGVSKYITLNTVITEQCGTPAYIAPEILGKTGYSGFSSDIWSLGVLLYTMTMASVPFKAANINELKKSIIAGRNSFPDKLSPVIKSLLSGMLNVDPRARITIPEILQHPWLKTYSNEGKIKLENVEESLKMPGLNISNIFPRHRDAFITKEDYRFIIGDFYSRIYEEDALKMLESLGMKRENVLKGLRTGDINHATATYNLLIS